MKTPIVAVQLNGGIYAVAAAAVKDKRRIDPNITRTRIILGKFANKNKEFVVEDPYKAEWFPSIAKIEAAFPETDYRLQEVIHAKQYSPTAFWYLPTTSAPTS